MNTWLEIISRGRVIQTLIIVVCGAICLVGGNGGWLDGKDVLQVILAMLAALGLKELGIRNEQK